MRNKEGWTLDDSKAGPPLPLTGPYNDEEIKALDEKMLNPDKVVICPRCGKKLKYYQQGSGTWVKCETEGCLYDAIRGL